MSISLAGTSPNDLFADSVARLRSKRWSPEDVDPAKNVDLFAEQLVKLLTSPAEVVVSLTATTPYQLFRNEIARLRDRQWDASPGSLRELRDVLVAVFGSGVPIGINASSTSLYELFRAGIAMIRQRRWTEENGVREFADELVNLLSSKIEINVTA